MSHWAVAQATTNAPYVAILPSAPHKHNPPSKTPVPKTPPQIVYFKRLQRDAESQRRSTKRAKKALTKAIHQAGAMKLSA